MWASITSVRSRASQIMRFGACDTNISRGDRSLLLSFYLELSFSLGT